MINYSNTIFLFVTFFLYADSYISRNALTETDFENAELLTKEEIWGKEKHIRLDEVNGHRSDIREFGHKRFRRNGINKPAKLWPGAKIPYSISPHYSSRERALLAKAIKQYHEKTCVRFVPRSPREGDYLFIGKVDGCFSEVGRTSGIQVLSLDDGCMDYTTIIHEMMHVVGFYHEHERWDRDNYIDIIWQNIDKAALDQFGKVDLSKTSYYGQPYDYNSILHYDSLAFSKNGFPTMLPKKKGLASTIGNAKDFSDIDLAKINRMYECSEKIHLLTSLMGMQGSLSYSPLKRTNDFVKKAYFDDLPKSTDLALLCADRLTICWLTRDRCTVRALHLIMKTFCARTCDLC